MGYTQHGPVRRSGGWVRSGQVRSGRDLHGIASVLFSLLLLLPSTLLFFFVFSKLASKHGMELGLVGFLLDMSV